MQRRIAVQVLENSISLVHAGLEEYRRSFPQRRLFHVEQFFNALAALREIPPFAESPTLETHSFDCPLRSCSARKMFHMERFHRCVPSFRLADEQYAAVRERNRSRIVPAKVWEQRLCCFGLAVSDQHRDTTAWLEKLLRDQERPLEALYRSDQSQVCLVSCVFRPLSEHVYLR